MAWDQREVELERQLDIFDHQQNEILKAAQKVWMINSVCYSIAWPIVLTHRSGFKVQSNFIDIAFFYFKYKWGLTMFCPIVVTVLFLVM